MDFQKMINDAKAKADANSDGKLSTDDLDGLAKQYGVDPKHLDGLKAKADANGDGKIDLEDVKSGFSNLDDIAGSLKDKMFGSK